MTQMLLSVDPGTRSLAWASWHDRLSACGLARTKKQGLGAQAHDLVTQLPAGDLEVVVELPRIYPYDKKRQPNDLIDLAFVAGMCGLLGDSVTAVVPTTWKGQTPKPIHHRRIMEQLTMEELLVVKACIANIPKSLRHNVIDAIGIGLYYRTGKKT